MKTVHEEIRKGPWTEQEDFQLVCFVGLFGDRRWDFIAKVSGLKVAGDNNRTGKSCRLRWVNYLHPGLKRGKLSPQEERLVLELQSKWGNRWSRIARKLPGRTDNEIKNYWRTHMRKTAQERKRAMSPPSPSSNCSSASSNPTTDSIPSTETGQESFHDTECKTPASTDQKSNEMEKNEGIYSMDDIWKEIALTEGKYITPVWDAYGDVGCDFSCPPVTSPAWESSSDSLWHIDGEENKMFLSMDNHLFSHYDMRGSL